MRNDLKRHGADKDFGRILVQNTVAFWDLAYTLRGIPHDCVVQSRRSFVVWLSRHQGGSSALITIPIAREKRAFSLFLYGVRDVFQFYVFCPPLISNFWDLFRRVPEVGEKI